MFIGEFKHNLDIKGRLAIPAKFRKDLEEGAIINKGIEKCLSIYTRKSWESFAEKIKNLPTAKSDARAFNRSFFSQAAEVELDNQGRILIPENLRQPAALNKKAIVIGLYDKIEIWDEETWKEYRGKTEKNAVEIAEQLSDLGI